MLPDSVHIGRQSRPLKGFSHFHNRGRNKRIFKTSGSELQICPIVQGNISALMAQKRRLRIKCMRNLPTKERRKNDGKADADIPDIKARN